MQSSIRPYGHGFYVKVVLTKGKWDEAVQWLAEHAGHVNPSQARMPWRIASTVRSYEWDEMGVDIKDELIAHQFFLTFGSSDP